MTRQEWELEKDNLHKLIYEEQLPYDEIGKLYNCSGNNVRKYAKLVGIELPVRRTISEKEHFNKIDKETSLCIECGEKFTITALRDRGRLFCSKQCACDYEAKKRWEYYLDNQEEFEETSTLTSFTRKFKPHILREQSNKCIICGIENQWNGKDLVLILDHIDGDASNNIRENLRLVCPNCDSQLDTYKRKNKNGTRAYRRK